MKIKLDEKTKKLDFFNCLGEKLSLPMIEREGLAGLIFEFNLLNIYEKRIGYICKNSYGKLGAISYDGKNIIPFEYERIESCCKDSMGGFLGVYKAYKKKEKQLYDIYSVEVGFIASDVTFYKFSNDDIFYKRENHELGIFHLKNNNIQKFHIKGMIHSISYEYKQLIIHSISNTSQVFDFNENLLYEFPETINFTEQKDFFKFYKNYKIGLYEKEEIILEPKYREILQVFSSKAVVKNSLNRIRVVSWKKGIYNKNGKLKLKWDTYKLTTDIYDAFFLEDESEAIFTFSKESDYPCSKMLMSHYFAPFFLKNNIFDEIVWIHNKNDKNKSLYTLFKGIKINENIATFRYMDGGLILPMESSCLDTDSYYHIIYNYKDTTYQGLVSADGTVLVPISEEVYEIIPFSKSYNGKLTCSEYQWKVDEIENGLFYVKTYNCGYSKKKIKTGIVNANKNCNHEIKDDLLNKPSLLFGNYVKQLHKVSNVKTDEEVWLNYNLIVFDNYLLENQKHKLLVYDNNFKKIEEMENFSEIKDFYFNEISFKTKKQVFSFTHKYGFQIFDYKTEINGIAIYENQEGIYFINNSMITKEMLQFEIKCNFISNDFSVLIS